MQDIGIDSLIAEDETIKDLREKQQKYHQVFQQLSNTRTQLRKYKHQNQLLKTNLNGTQQQVQTLRDIIRKKKEIITAMRNQLDQKTLQLNVIENQVYELGKDKEELTSKLIAKLKEHDDIQRMINEAQQEVVKTSQQNHFKCNQIQTLKEQIDGFRKQIVILQMSKQNVQKIMSQFQTNVGTSLQQQIQTLVETINRSKNSRQLHQKNATYLQMRMEELENTIEELNSSLCRKQQQISMMKSKFLKQKQYLKGENKQLCQKLQLKQVQEKQNKERYCNLNHEYSRMLARLDNLKDEISRTQKKSICNVMPIIRAVLGQDISELVMKYVQSQDQEELILSNQIDRQCSLVIYNQNRLLQVDSNNQNLRNRLIQAEEQNQILKIKIINLEKAYEHAIDDYRRSLKFKAICQSSKGSHSQSIKENLSTNY